MSEPVPVAVWSGEIMGLKVYVLDGESESRRKMMTISEQWCVFCKREPLAHTPEEYDRCMTAAGKQPFAGELAALRKVAEAARSFCAGGSYAVKRDAIMAALDELDRCAAKGDEGGSPR